MQGPGKAEALRFASPGPPMQSNLSVNGVSSPVDAPTPARAGCFCEEEEEEEE